MDPLLGRGRAGRDDGELLTSTDNPLMVGADVVALPRCIVLNIVSSALLASGGTWSMEDVEETLVWR